MKVSTRDMMRGWKPALAALGYKVTGSSALRPVGKLCHSLWIQRGVRMVPGKCRLNLNVGIWDPFLEGPGYIAALTAHVEKDAVRFMEREAWWTDDQAPAMLQAFSDFGPSWFQQMAPNPQTLLDLFQRALAANKPVRYLFEPIEGSVESLPFDLASLVKQVEPTISTPPIYCKYVSLLAHHQGENNLACCHAHNWLQHLRRGKELPGSTEPNRTLRQLEEMGCSGKLSAARVN